MALALGLRNQPYSFQINIFYVFTLVKFAGRYRVVLTKLSLKVAALSRYISALL